MSRPPTDAEVFAGAFNKIRRRFNLAPDDEMAADYFAYLSAFLSLDEMLSAMHAIWATREFFPKPADFVTAFVPGEWRKVQECMDGWTEARDWIGSREVWPTLSERSKAACIALGGVPSMRTQPDIVKLKAAWEREYAQAVQAEAMEQSASLPLFADRRTLSRGGQRQIGSGNH
jgi:hypothetical protein